MLLPIPAATDPPTQNTHSKKHSKPPTTYIHISKPSLSKTEDSATTMLLTLLFWLLSAICLTTAIKADPGVSRDTDLMMPTSIMTASSAVIIEPSDAPADLRDVRNADTIMQEAFMHLRWLRLRIVGVYCPGHKGCILQEKRLRQQGPSMR